MFWLYLLLCNDLPLNKGRRVPKLRNAPRETPNIGPRIWGQYWFRKGLVLSSPNFKSSIADNCDDIFNIVFKEYITSQRHQICCCWKSKKVNHSSSWALMADFLISSLLNIRFRRIKILIGKYLIKIGSVFYHLFEALSVAPRAQMFFILAGHVSCVTASTWC